MPFFGTGGNTIIYMYMYINISRVTSWTRRSFDATEVKVELHEIKWIKIMKIPVPRDINNHLLIIQESNALLNACAVYKYKAFTHVRYRTPRKARANKEKLKSARNEH